MKAWRVYERNNIKLDEMDSQPVGENCVKLKVLSSAVSLSDIAVYDGRIKADYPIILGRQCVAMVTEVGEGVTNLNRGDKVAASPFAGCHACAACSAGKVYECERPLVYGETEDGFLRDFAVVNAADLYVLPERVVDRDAVFLEHIATAINTVSKLDLEKGEHIVIVGASIIGIILAQVAIYYQAVPILIDSREDRLELASQLGVYYTVNTVESDPYKKIFSLTGGRMSETVAYMSGSNMPFGRSFEYASKNGRVAVVGWNTDDELNASLNTVLTNRLTVMGVNDTGKNILSAINMLANKTVNVAPLITKEIEFGEVGQYIADMSASPFKYMKILVKI